MSTRRGWQAMVGELEAVLRHLNVAQGGTRRCVTVSCGSAPTPGSRGWPRCGPRRARRACPSLGGNLHRRGHPGHRPGASLSRNQAGAVVAFTAPTPTPASGTRRCDRSLYGHLRCGDAKQEEAPTSGSAFTSKSDHLSRSSDFRCFGPLGKETVRRRCSSSQEREGVCPRARPSRLRRGYRRGTGGSHGEVSMDTCTHVFADLHEATTYTVLQRVLQNHGTTHGMSLLAVLTAAVVLFTGTCDQLCEARRGGGGLPPTADAGGAETADTDTVGACASPPAARGR
jgi:hypothetical protein